MASDKFSGLLSLLQNGANVQVVQPKIPSVPTFPPQGSSGIGSLMDAFAPQPPGLPVSEQFNVPGMIAAPPVAPWYDTPIMQAGVGGTFGSSPINFAPSMDAQIPAMEEASPMMAQSPPQQVARSPFDLLTAQRAPVAPLPTGPNFQPLPQFDANRRGQERAALESLAIGAFLGGGRGAIAGLTGGVQGFNKGNQTQFGQDMTNAQGKNKVEADRFKAAMDQWTAGEKQKDAAFSGQVRYDANGIRLNNDLMDDRQKDAALKEGIRKFDVKLAADMDQFATKNLTDRQNIATRYLQFVQTNGGTMDIGSQGMMVARYNQMASAAGLPPMPVPGTIYQGEDGQPRMVPPMGLSPSAVTAKANERLSGARTTDIKTDNDRAANNQEFMQGHIKRVEALNKLKRLDAVQVQEWRESSKEIDQAINYARMSAKDDVGKPVSEDKKMSIMKELASSADAILAARSSRGKPPVSDDYKGMANDPDFLSDYEIWKERGASGEAKAQNLREYYNAIAARIGYKFDGSGYVPGSAVQSGQGGDTKSADQRAVEAYATTPSKGPAAPVTVNVPSPKPSPTPQNRPAPPGMTPKPTSTPRASAAPRPASTPSPKPSATPKPALAMSVQEIQKLPPAEKKRAIAELKARLSGKGKK